LLNDAVAYGKQPDGSTKEYQVILTTGYGKFPAEFEQFVVERFSEKDGNFILKPRPANPEESNEPFDDDETPTEQIQ